MSMSRRCSAWALSTEDNLAGRESHHELEHGGEAHEHDDFDSFSLTLDGVTSKDRLLAIIEETIRAHDVLRLKGFAALPGASARLAIQAVGPSRQCLFRPAVQARRAAYHRAGGDRRKPARSRRDHREPRAGHRCRGLTTA